MTLFKSKKLLDSLVIFLDVDGVLNRESDWRTPFYVRDDCVAVLKEICKLSRNTKIVLSSTWRVGYDKNGNTHRGDSLEIGLSKYGLKVEDVTPNSGGTKSRQEEIEYYIRRNQVGDYLILDDDESLFPNPSAICWYRVDYKKGLVKEDIRTVQKLLYN